MLMLPLLVGCRGRGPVAQHGTRRHILLLVIKFIHLPLRFDRIRRRKSRVHIAHHQLFVLAAIGTFDKVKMIITTMPRNSFDESIINNLRIWPMTKPSSKFSDECLTAWRVHIAEGGDLRRVRRMRHGQVTVGLRGICRMRGGGSGMWGRPGRWHSVSFGFLKLLQFARSCMRISVVGLQHNWPFKVDGTVIVVNFVLGHFLGLIVSLIVSLVVGLIVGLILFSYNLLIHLICCYLLLSRRRPDKVGSITVEIAGRALEGGWVG
mmetsp:Transcript_26241/g.75776  ORF Transcript_26241/g.75776 Transcript_26241/m.75776 type:complete len:264 (+) Transcript_26241:3000-3791(+)